MPVCKYFLEGRCRFGDNCWNEHPRGGGREQHHTAYSINRGSWGNQFQKHQSSYIQPSTFSKPATWGGGGRDVERRGFGCPDTGKKAISSSGSFVQNRFTTLSSDDQEHDLENLLEIVRKDIEAWEVSGQWLFSCYSVAKEYACVSGLVDFSPEELRLEYYNTRGGGSLQNYVDSIGQLSNQQRNRMLEIKKPNSSARISVSTELRKPNQQKAALGFGGVQTSTFGSSGFASSTASNNAFSFKPSTGLGNTTTASGFGSSSAPSVPPLSGFGTKPVPSSSAFGNTSTFGAPTTTAASTSAVFGTPATSSTPGTSVFGSSAPFGSNSTASSGFGNSVSTCAPTSSTFGSTAKATTNAFGGTAASTTNAFGGTAASTTNAFGGTAASTTNAFGGTAASTTNAFGGTAASTTNAFGGIAATTTNALGGIAVPVSQPQNTSANNNTVSGCDKLYTPRTELSADDLREFEAKKFTLGRIPLRPPPIELLNV